MWVGNWSRPALFVIPDMTFRQLLNVRILQNLATTRESISPQKVSEEIFENFSLWVIC